MAMTNKSNKPYPQNDPMSSTKTYVLLIIFVIGGLIIGISLLGPLEGSGPVSGRASKQTAPIRQTPELNVEVVNIAPLPVDRITDDLGLRLQAPSEPKPATGN